jgi:lysophospholipase L1-like esterase
MRRLVPALILGAATLAGCGGGSPSDPDPTPAPGSPVSGYVFYDENGNGTADASETVRLPSVQVLVGGVTGSTSAGGRFALAAVPNGAQSAQARPESLPAYFMPGTAVSVSVPAPGDVAVPAALPLGSRARTNVYLAFGDSITAGDGSADHSGYRDELEAELRAFWGKATIEADGQSGTRSNRGAIRLPASLGYVHPAYVLILYGTNDWNEPECRDAFPCYTVDSLRSMIHRTRESGGFPILGTIPPVNPAYVDLRAAERNDWVKRMNDQVRAMARQENVAIAEVHGEFMKQSSLPPFFTDLQHPNDAGYRLISRAFFAAITNPVSGAASSRRGLSFSFGPPGDRF